MKRILAILAAAALFAVPALAADTVVYNARTGSVTFDHKAHAKKFACKECHSEAIPKKIKIEGKDAHTLCLTCHKKQKDAKVSGTCKECHKR